MEAETAQAVVQRACAAHDAAEPLRRYLEAEANALLRTLRFWVYKAGLGRADDEAILALEVLSLVTIEALQAADRFDPSRSPKAWLLGIATNVIKRLQKEHMARSGREVVASALENTASQSEGDEALFDRIADLAATAPDAAVISSAAAEALLALVSSEDRQVLRLAVLADLDGTALGQALGVPPGTARVRLHRALTRLRAAHAATQQEEEEGRHG